MLRYIYILLFVLLGLTAFGQDEDFPVKPNPPRLVNDFAHMMTPGQVESLEHKLEEYARTSSTQITVVSVLSLGDHEASEYSFELGNRWGIGQKQKDNGVLILTSLNDRKGWIAVGYGLEGTLTDALTGRIYRNELVPAFKQKEYYEGFNRAADAIIAATKGEYMADKSDHAEEGEGIPIGIIILVVLIIVWILSKISGGGGGSYMSGRGRRMWGGGWYGGGMGGGSFGGGGWGGSGSGSGGFGGFGGGSFGGGGAGGSW